MADLNYQRMVIGYHGCDARVAAKVLSGEHALEPSQNDYDWLGKGIYFWEHGPQRAYDWACDLARQFPKRVKRPAILGAFINLGHCFDLLDTANTTLLEDLFPGFRRFTLGAGREMPRNAHAPGGDGQDFVLRRLDCAVVNWSLAELAKAGKEYQTVRGVFVEGHPAYPGAGIMLKSHIQVAVRDQQCIVGFFRPNPLAYLATTEAADRRGG
jgi:hypothetical protein